MASKFPCQNMSPQRLFAMLEDCQSREDESWRKLLLSNTVKETEIGPKQRDFAVAWLSQLNTRFNFYPETFFLAVHNLDRFLTAVKSHPKYLKCIAATCLYIASKLIEEEEHVPGTGELVEISQSGCRPQDILRMERIILVKLCWDLHIPTALTYMEIFYFLALSSSPKFNSKKLFNSEENFLSVANHLNQLSLELQHAMCSYALAPFPSCAVALALISLRIEVLSHEFQYWTAITSKIQSLAKIKTSDFMLCRNILQSLLPLKRYCPSSGNAVYVVSTLVQNSGGPLPASYCSPVYQTGPMKRKANEVISAWNAPHDVKKFHLTKTETRLTETVKCQSDSSESLNEEFESICPPLTKLSDESVSGQNYNDLAVSVSGGSEFISDFEHDEQCIDRMIYSEHNRRLTYAEIVKFGVNSDAVVASPTEQDND